MSSLVLQWEQPSILVLDWVGPLGSIQSISRQLTSQVAAVIGPPGPSGSAPSRFDISNSATWIIPHGFGRVPIVQVFLANGEQVIADVVADSNNITVTHASARSGFVLAN